MSQAVEFQPPVPISNPPLGRRRQRRSRSQTAVGAWMVAPAVVLLITFIIVPILLTFALAFTDAKLVSPEGPQLIGFDNFTRLFHDEVFWKYLRNTIVFAVVVVPVQAGFAL